ncbi:MAG TPA: methyltransferase domain-containing protein [Stellaceae bacterium]|nr:methyltransferase domain-containing protein [Stellaceae bacterium]
MADDWLNPDFARRWDAGAEVGNPARGQQLDLVTALVAAEYRPDSTILDLGAGSGQVEAMLLKARPDARIVAVDSSPAMLALARERLGGASDKVSLVEGDFAEPERIALPPRDYGIALLIQTLHHVPNDRKRRALAVVARALSPGGLLILVDRLTLADGALRSVHGSMWSWLERSAAVKSGWSADDLFRRIAKKEDHTAGLEEHLSLLREAGFTAACLQLELNRAVFVGRRGR